jgi:hypothetical protein
MRLEVVFRAFLLAESIALHVLHGCRLRSITRFSGF